MGILSGGVLRGDTDRSKSLWFDNRDTHLSWEALGIGNNSICISKRTKICLEEVKKDLRNTYPQSKHRLRI
jgi:hypothetical protein